MAITIDADPNSDSANSYVTLEWANEWLVASLDAVRWNATGDGAVSNDDKAKALITATRMVDTQTVFKGSKSRQTQPLAWPRTGATDESGREIADDVFPLAVMEATADLASDLVQNALITRNAESDPETAGLRKLKVGTIEIEFNSEDRRKPVPSFIAARLAGLVANVATATGVSGLSQIPVDRGVPV